MYEGSTGQYIRWVMPQFKIGVPKPIRGPIPPTLLGGPPILTTPVPDEDDDFEVIVYKTPKLGKQLAIEDDDDTRSISTSASTKYQRVTEDQRLPTKTTD